MILFICKDVLSDFSRIRISHIDRLGNQVVDKLGKLVLSMEEPFVIFCFLSDGVFDVLHIGVLCEDAVHG